jgi:hypothetical protein
MSYLPTYPFRGIVSHMDIPRNIRNRFFSLLFWFVFRHRWSQLLKKLVWRLVMWPFVTHPRQRRPGAQHLLVRLLQRLSLVIRRKCGHVIPRYSPVLILSLAIFLFQIPSTINGKPSIYCVFMEHLRFPCFPTQFCMNFSRNLRRPMTFPAFRHHTTNSTRWSVQIVERSATSRQGGREFPLHEVWPWLEISHPERHPAILGFRLMTI